MRTVDGPFKSKTLTSAVEQFDSVSRVILVILETKNKILKARYAPLFQVSFLDNPFVGKRRPSRSFIAWNSRRCCPIIRRSIFDEAGIAYFLGRKRSSVMVRVIALTGAANAPAQSTHPAMPAVVLITNNPDM
jgi:hypothetical protein